VALNLYLSYPPGPATFLVVLFLLRFELSVLDDSDAEVGRIEREGLNKQLDYS
jgi:hypothetical protein